MQIAYNKGRILLDRNNRPARIDTGADGLVFHVAGPGCGPASGYDCMSVSDTVAGTFPAIPCDASPRWVGLREAYRLMEPEAYAAAVKGSELLWWDSQTRCCGVCGALMERASEISKRCPDCGREVFPQLSPAIAVLVKRGDKALLVHAANFRGPMHALVAGFVETGESLEECVVREVREETSLEIEDVRYFGSQSWPFPAQLMIAFTARWKSGEIRFADGELTSGGFFSRENPPQLPTPPSLSRRLIDAWLNGEV